MHITVDMDFCESHGQCVIAAPKVFWFNDQDKLEFREDIREDELPAVQEAIDLCPIMAIAFADANRD
jgi:ferredoxin